MIHHPLLFAAPFLLIAATMAQSPIRTLPSVAHNAAGNDFRSGGQTTRLRSQTWFHRSNLPAGLVIREISLRRTNRSSAAYTADLRIRLDNSTLSDKGLSPTLDKNLGRNAVEVFKGSVKIPASGPATSPFDPVGFVKLTKPFVFTGPHLIVDLDYVNLKAQGPLFIDFVSMERSPALHLTSPPNCGASIAARYAGGNFHVSNSTPFPPSAPLLLMVGVDNVGGTTERYPMDLTGLGMPGCSLGLTPLVTLPLTADAAGNIAPAFPFTLPADAVMGSVQAVHQSSKTPLGVAVTNTVNSVLGARGGFTTMTSADGVNGVLRPWNVAPVLLLK